MGDAFGITRRLAVRHVFVLAFGVFVVGNLAGLQQRGGVVVNTETTQLGTVLGILVS